MIYYPMAVFQDHAQAPYGGILPDLPGCYPVGDSVEELMADAAAAAAFHIEGMLEDNLPVSQRPQSIAECRLHPDYEQAVLWVLVGIDETAFSKQVRINISWPESLLRQVDAYAAAHHETRSGFLAKAARKMLQNTEAG